MLITRLAARSSFSPSPKRFPDETKANIPRLDVLFPRKKRLDRFILIVYINQYNLNYMNKLIKLNIIRR